MINPFMHQDSKCWIYLSIISYCIIEMLTKIKNLQGGLFHLLHERNPLFHEEQEESKKVKFA